MTKGDKLHDAECPMCGRYVRHHTTDQSQQCMNRIALAELIVATKKEKSES